MDENPIAKLVAGIDEAGRGPLAGSVVAAAVILDSRYPIDGLTDSKKLSERRRAALELEIKARARAWAVAEATHEEIDRYRMQAVIGGDLSEPCISAASILAKQYRDRQMLDLDRQFPEYQFARHKGYPTALHRELLQRHGACPAHRRSFRPVRELL